MSQRRITLERTFDAAVEDLWDLWTTPEGFESWWAPDGFRAEVRELRAEVGGDTVYVMTAFAPDQVDFLKKAGMPLVSEDRMTMTEMVPMRRLGYSHVVDFLPGVEPYRVAMDVEFSRVDAGARMVVTMDVMHDEQMTRLAVMGMESQLGRLEARFGSSVSDPR